MREADSGRKKAKQNPSLGERATEARLDTSEVIFAGGAMMGVKFLLMPPTYPIGVGVKWGLFLLLFQHILFWALNMTFVFRFKSQSYPL